VRDAKLADRRVRLAFDLALDRVVLIQTVLGGRGRQAATMQPPGHWAVDPALAPRRQDRARAAALLDAALPVAPAQGAASAAAGAGAAAVVSAAPRLRLRLLTTASAQRRAEAEAIARQLAAVGVAVEVRSLEVGSLLAAVRAGQFDLYLLGLPEPLEPDYLAWMFHSGNASRRDAVPTSPSPYARLDRDLPRPAPPPEDLVRFPQCRSQHARAAARALIALGRAGVGLPVDHGAGNRTGYADPLVDCLVELGQAAATSAERAALYRAVGQRLHRDLPVLSLWHEDVAVLVGDRFDLPPPAADGSLAPWASARSRGAARNPLPPRAAAPRS
jgi:ABC-type transport system substrate-binding protein